MSEAHRAHALAIVKTLRGAGYQALFAGGCVRDMLLGRDPSDIDVATDATPEVVMSLFRRTLPVGVSFGVVRVLGPRGSGEVEVATFRSDGEYRDGRRPESVTFGNARDDAMRRDFTINGMFYDPSTDEVIDFVGGRADLASETIRAIGDPRARFAEDKLRLLRAVRFAARLGFSIESRTWAAIVEMAPEVSLVSAERISQEWRKMIVDRCRALAMELARRSGLIAAILPELEAIVDVNIPTRHLGDQTVWWSILATLGNLPDEPSFSLALAALLHRVEPVASVDEVARRLKLSTAERERIVWLLTRQRSMWPITELSVARLKRFLSEPGIGELLTLERAIAWALTQDDQHIRELEEYCRRQPDGPINPPPLISGRDLIEAGLRPGPEFSARLERVRDAQLEGVIGSKDEAITLALNPV